jgi:hypothetical protein
VSPSKRKIINGLRKRRGFEWGSGLPLRELQYLE